MQIDQEIGLFQHLGEQLVRDLFADRAIGATGKDTVDDFNQLVMDVFNAASGNLLLPDNLLSWNVYFTEPAVVDRQEWRDHAEKWRESIDADHGSPDGPGTSARYLNGDPFEPGEELIQEEIDRIIAWLKAHLSDF